MKSVRILHWSPGTSERYMLQEKNVQLQLGHHCCIVQINEEVQNDKWVLIDISRTRSPGNNKKIIIAFRTPVENIPKHIYGGDMIKFFTLYSTDALMAPIVEKNVETVVFSVVDMHTDGLVSEDLIYDHTYFDYFKKYIDPAIAERETTKKLVGAVKPKRSGDKSPTSYAQFEIDTIERLFYLMPEDTRVAKAKDIEAKIGGNYSLTQICKGERACIDWMFLCHPGKIAASSFLDQNSMEEYKKVMREVD